MIQATILPHPSELEEDFEEDFKEDFEDEFEDEFDGAFASLLHLGLQ